MTTNRVLNLRDDEAVAGSVCPECGHSEIETIWTNRSLPYGAGSEAVELQVRVPVRKCRTCRFEFLDEEAEDLQHEAVCRHLGVLTPAEIRGLRERLGLSRGEFARLTRFGEATIARWERGELIQNAGNDSLLWLLQYEDNERRLRKRAERAEPLILRRADPKDPRREVFHLRSAV